MWPSIASGSRDTTPNNGERPWENPLLAAASRITSYLPIQLRQALGAPFRALGASKSMPQSDVDHLFAHESTRVGEWPGITPMPRLTRAWDATADAKSGDLSPTEFREILAEDCLEAVDWLARQSRLAGRLRGRTSISSMPPTTSTPMITTDCVPCTSGSTRRSVGCDNRLTSSSSARTAGCKLSGWMIATQRITRGMLSSLLRESMIGFPVGQSTFERSSNGTSRCRRTTWQGTRHRLIQPSTVTNWRHSDISELQHSHRDGLCNSPESRV